jgi:hypothetical protein
MRRKQEKEETYELRGGPRTTKRELQAFMLDVSNFHGL